MKLVRHKSKYLNNTLPAKWAIQCCNATYYYTIGRLCSKCSKPFPKEMLRKRDFLNGMSDL